MKNIIRKIEEFIVDGLGKITVYTPINGNKATIYRGKTVLGFTVPSEPPVQLPLDFYIADAASVEDAFAKFEEAEKSQFDRNMQIANKMILDLSPVRCNLQPAEAHSSK